MGSSNLQSTRVDKIRVLSFSLVLLMIIILHEVTSILTAAMDEATRGLIGTIEFFGSFLLMYLAVVVFLKWEQENDVSTLGLQTDERTIYHVLIGLIAGVAAALIVYLIAFFFGGDLRPVSEITEDLIMTEIIITVPVAFFEELAYRGYLMTRMERIRGRTTAILLSSLWFALLHFSWWIPLGSVPIHLIPIFTFNLFLGGVVLGLSYYWSGERLWVPIAFHFAWNMLAYILFPVYPLEPVSMVEIFQIEWGITTVIGFLFGLSLIWVLLKEFLKNK